MTKLVRLLKINIIFCIAFSLSCISWHGDLSLIAFPLTVLFSVYIWFIPSKDILVYNSPKRVSLLRHSFQYEPFVFITAFVFRRAGNSGIPFLLDLAGALFWIGTAVISYMIQFMLGEKKVWNICPEWNEWHKNHPVVKREGLTKVCFEIFEWIDALVQAVFTIILLNIFLFQLYEIPSESMVPAFLVKDRVVVVKTLAGPKFPLSRVGLPYLQKYKKGDIVVFRNPHYSDDRKSEVKTFLSQFLYMCSLTLLKTNTDENGELKADPLVKRIAAVPGEQIYMLDGILYSRTKDNENFMPSKIDMKFAAWDLNKLSKRTKDKVQWIPLSVEKAEATLELEQQRRDMDLNRAKAECLSISQEFKKYTKALNSNTDITNFVPLRDRFVYNLFSNANNMTLKLLSSDGGEEWFDMFMNSWWRENSGAWDESYFKDDRYGESNFRLNVMCKLTFGQIILRNAELIAAKIPADEWKNDKKRTEYLEHAQKLVDYIMELDMRNLPLFPANDSDGNPVYISDGCFFMMGDNRYNSLDMRHSYEHKPVGLTVYDSCPVVYYTNLEPRQVHQSKILGRASFRFWPLDRAGIPGTSLREGR